MLSQYFAVEPFFFVAKKAMAMAQFQQLLESQKMVAKLGDLLFFVFWCTVGTIVVNDGNIMVNNGNIVVNNGFMDHRCPFPIGWLMNRGV